MGGGGVNFICSVFLCWIVLMCTVQTNDAAKTIQDIDDKHNKYTTVVFTFGMHVSKYYVISFPASRVFILHVAFVLFHPCASFRMNFPSRHNKFDLLHGNYRSLFPYCVIHVQHHRQFSSIHFISVWFGLVWFRTSK